MQPAQAPAWPHALPLALATLVACASCAGGSPKVDTQANQATPAVESAADGGAAAAAMASSVATVAAPNAVAEAGAPAEPRAKPFANNSLEATSMINDAVDAQSGPLTKCIEAARARHKNLHGKISIEIGIDQEGVLMGVKTPKGQTHDGVMNDCVRDALTGANFPRSHAGVITLKRSFEDQAVYK
jgi:hypothetical protein